MTACSVTAESLACADVLGWNFFIVYLRLRRVPNNAKRGYLHDRVRHTSEPVLLRVHNKVHIGHS